MNVQPIVGVVAFGLYFSLFGLFLWLFSPFLRTGPAQVSSRDLNEPLAPWVRMACAIIDCGGLWLEDDLGKARRMLAQYWDVTDAASWSRTLAGLLEGLPGLSAWDGVRALRVLMAGARVGYCSEPTAWGAARAIAVELSRRYTGFDQLAVEYLVARRRAFGVPADGSGDDDVMRNCVANIVVQRAQNWRDVAFDAFHEAPTYDVRDAATFRAALVAPSRLGPAPHLWLMRCAFCRVMTPASKPTCERCGAPLRDV